MKILGIRAMSGKFLAHPIEGIWYTHLLRRAPMVSKTAYSTTFNFDRPLGLSMRGKETVKDVYLSLASIATDLCEGVFN